RGRRGSVPECERAPPEGHQAALRRRPDARAVRGARRHPARAAEPPPWRGACCPRRRWSVMTAGVLTTAGVLPYPRRPRIAVLGAGHTGPVIARVAMDAGYPVSIAASGDPGQIELSARVRPRGAEPRWAADAAEEADIVVLAIPLHKFATLGPSLVAGKLVIDT